MFHRIGSWSKVAAPSKRPDLKISSYFENEKKKITFLNNKSLIDENNSNSCSCRRSSRRRNNSNNHNSEAIAMKTTKSCEIDDNKSI